MRRMYKIAVVGGRDSVLGFQALGLSVFPVETAEEARRVIRATAKEAYAIIYLTEQLGTQLKDLLAQYEKELAPAVILIPGKEGSLGIGMQKITETVERAVGADILA